MTNLAKALSSGKNIRAIGVDDAPFENTRGSRVNVSGIICAGTRFEGMLWDQVSKDGSNATDVLCNMILHSKFYPQLHLVLLDGIAVGGFNIIRLQVMQRRLNLPCIAVMRKQPNLDAIDKALKCFEDYTERVAAIREAGPVIEKGGFVYQVAGAEAGEALAALEKLTDTGKVPEALRLAHIIGAAIMTGESSSRA